MWHTRVNRDRMELEDKTLREGEVSCHDVTRSQSLNVYAAAFDLLLSIFGWTCVAVRNTSPLSSE